MVSLLRMGVRGVFERGFSASVVVAVFPKVSLASFRREIKTCLHRYEVPSLWSSQNQAARYYGKEAVGRTDRGYKREADAESDSDSDSDTERRPREKGNSEFWRRKMRTFHGLIDLNRDGVVSYDDFKILSERFVNLGHLSARQQDEFQAALKVVWEDQWGLAHPYNLVTTEQYLENMHHVINDKTLRSKAHHFLPHLFQAVDKNKNGCINVEEFKVFFECLGLGSEEALQSFKCIDVNEDGFVSAKEFVKLGRDYFLTEDERRPSKVFWGPLMMP